MLLTDFCERGITGFYLWGIDRSVVDSSVMILPKIGYKQKIIIILLGVATDEEH